MDSRPRGRGPRERPSPSPMARRGAPTAGRGSPLPARGAQPPDRPEAAQDDPPCGDVGCGDQRRSQGRHRPERLGGQADQPESREDRGRYPSRGKPADDPVQRDEPSDLVEGRRLAPGPVAAARREAAEPRDGEGEGQAGEGGGAAFQEQQTQGHEEHRQAAGRIQQRRGMRRDRGPVQHSPTQVGEDRAQTECAHEAGGRRRRRALRVEGDRGPEGAEERQQLDGVSAHGCAHANRAGGRGSRPRTQAVWTTWSTDPNR
jgi:hypothetical protein